MKSFLSRFIVLPLVGVMLLACGNINDVPDNEKKAMSEQGAGLQKDMVVFDGRVETLLGSTYDGGYGAFADYVGSGDFNGDGFDDVFGSTTYWGAPVEIPQGGSKGPGVLSIFYGGSNGFSSETHIQSPLEAKAYFSESDDFWCYAAGAHSAARSAGDVDHDGCDDIIVGAPGYNGFVIFYGSEEGITASNYTFIGTNINRIGHSVQSAGYVNNDEYADVVVTSPSAYAWAGFGRGGGVVRIYYGSVNGISADNYTELDNPFASDATPAFGSDAVGVGDLNGDSFGDVAVGVAWWKQVWIYRGTADGIETSPVAKINCSDIGGNAGWSLAPAGDINGDTIPDIIVGSPNLTNGGYCNGGSFAILFGSGNETMVLADKFSFLGRELTEGATYRASYAWTVAPAGDVNQDGLDDIVIGEKVNWATHIPKLRVFFGCNDNTMVEGIDLDPAADHKVERCVASADINGDGAREIIGASRGTNSVKVFYIENTFFRLQNKATGGFLKSVNSNDWTNLVMAPATDTSDNTLWKKVDTGDGYFRLQNKATGMWFRPDNGDHKCYIKQVTQEYTGDWPRWKCVSTDDGYFRLQDKSTGFWMRPENSASDSAIWHVNNTFTGNWPRWRFVH